LNTFDSPKGDNSWGNSELLETDKYTYNGMCAIAVDTNDVPHVVYQLYERYKGKDYITLYYANRAGGIWNKIVIWPKERKIDAPLNFDIAIGPDNIPYILMGMKILKGNANIPIYFEEKDLTGAESFVIHKSGDVRIAFANNGNYANYVHDHTKPWDSGWNFYDSGFPYHAGELILVNEIPYYVQLSNGAIWVQREFQEPVLVAQQPSGHTWESITTRWSFYPNQNTNIVDIGTTSWVKDGIYSTGINYYWYVNFHTSMEAAFSVNSFEGVAPLTVQFLDKSGAPEGFTIVSWAWDFDNDGTIDSNLQNPIHTYTDIGKYSIRLTVTDSNGYTDTQIKKDYIEVTTDNDGDGVFDSKDNCPSNYNATQVDLDDDGIGDACDEHIDLISQVVYSTGLKSDISSEINSSDVTVFMKDGFLGQSKRIQKLKNRYDILSLRTNVDAKQLTSYVLSVYVSDIYEGNPQIANVYAYNADGISVQSYLLNFTLSTGWNDLDLFPLLHLMDGFGFVKFRIVPLNNWIDVSEAWISASSSRGLDDWEINVEPQAIDFGSVSAGGYAWQNITISNSKTGALVLGQISNPIEPFKINSDKCSGRSLSASESCTITIGFAPSAEGIFSDEITILSNDYDKPWVKISLKGLTSPASVLSGNVTDEVTEFPVSDVTVTVTIPKQIDLSPEDYRYSSGCLDYLPADTRDLYSTFLSDSYENVQYNDENKVLTLNDRFGSQYCVHLFKVKNPVNTCDPFEIVWNGIAGNSNVELFAQSFKPERSGHLTKVSLLLSIWPNFQPSGSVYVKIKSSLDNEINAVLTTSDPVGINTLMKYPDYSWKDFYFSKPVVLNSGQIYYLEVYTSRDNSPPIIVAGSSADQYTGGNCFKRYWGTWMGRGSSTNNDISFKTYIDNITDQRQSFYDITYPENEMAGVESDSVTYDIFNTEYNSWQLIGSKSSESGFDISIENVINGNMHQYYDSDGWISTRIRSDYKSFTAIATDLFEVLFLDIKTTATGPQGMYSIPNLPQGTYTAVFEKPGYEKKTITGTIIPGQSNILNIQLTPLPKASLTGMVTDTYSLMPLPGAVITIKNSYNTYTTTTDTDGLYGIYDLAEGDYTAAFEKTGYVKKTIGVITFHAGENRVLNIDLIPANPLNVAITSPQDGALLNSSPITVTGNVTNNAQVTVNGVQASVINGVFSASIPLNEGTNTITATATDQYGQTASHSITVILSTPPTISNIAVSNITIDSATISWTTDQPTSTFFEYGKTTEYGNSISDSALITNHSITLVNLAPDTTYHFRITSKNAYGLSSSSGDNTFATKIFSATTLGDYGNVTVMEVTGAYNAKNPDGSINVIPRQEIAKEFFKNHPDEYDFFVIFTNFDFSMPDDDAKAFYLEVKNDIQGIGKQIFDNASLFGSNSKLQGMIDMGNISALITNPLDPKFEEAVTLLAHEQMHRWGANVKFKDANGDTSTALLGKDGTHWNFLLDTDASVLYGNDWQDNKDGTFTSIGANKYYSPLDLYLMGIYDKTQVPPMLLIDNPALDPSRLPEVGATISGTPKYITTNDIIAAEGERIPNASQSQKAFKTAFLFITKPGTFTCSELPGIENIINAWAGRFASLTNGKGTIADIAPSITIYIASPSDGETITRPDTTVKGAIINSTGNETGVTVNGIVATVYENQFMANHVPLVDGADTIIITATDTAGNTATTTITVNAVTTGNYIRLTSNIESGIPPLEVSLRIGGSFNIENSSLNVTGPVQPEVLSSEVDEYTIRMTAEGIYYFTVSVTGPDDIVYEDTIAIVVMNKTQMNNLLKGKWEGMKTALLEGDIETSVAYFVSASQDRYRQTFTELSTDQLNAVFSNIIDLKVDDFNDGTAECGAIRVESDGPYSYPVTFVENENGIWKIMGF
jgi:PKD repeat protein